MKHTINYLIALFTLCSLSFGQKAPPEPMEIPGVKADVIGKKMIYFRLLGRAMNCPGQEIQPEANQEAYSAAQTELDTYIDEYNKTTAEIPIFGFKPPRLNGAIFPGKSPWGSYGNLGYTVEGLPADENGDHKFPVPLDIVITSKKECERLQDLLKDPVKSKDIIKNTFGGVEPFIQIDGELCAVSLKTSVRLVSTVLLARFEAKRSETCAKLNGGNCSIENTDFINSLSSFQSTKVDFTSNFVQEPGSLSCFAPNQGCPAFGYPVAGQASQCRFFYSNPWTSGDTNGDGKIDLSDLTLIANQLKEQDQPYMFSANSGPVELSSFPDVNRDGTATSADYNALKSALRTASPEQYLWNLIDRKYVLKMGIATKPSGPFFATLGKTQKGNRLYVKYETKGFAKQNCALLTQNGPLTLKGKSGVIDVGSYDTHKNFVISCTENDSFRAMRIDAVGTTPYQKR